MCGIAGVLAHGRIDPVELRTLTEAMTAALIRRGPDGEGFYCAAPIGLGHRRLAVIDVAGGAQPLYSADGAVVGIVNGEIYNFRKLRRALIELGYRFVTESDSEVVVHGYAAWGADMLDRLEGQFALAVWDARDHTLLLARDRMGEKPLFYAERDDALIFASELRALLRDPAVAVDVDPRALADYLVYEYVPAPRAMIRGARKLAAGEYLIAKPGQPARVAAYWDMPLGAAPRITDLDRAAGMLRRELERSVTERLVSDVPLGILLSGGLDSSLVTALAARARGGIETFSLGFDEPSYDESRHARRVAEHVGTRHHELIARPDDALALIADLGSLLDEPLGDGSIVPTHLLSRFARQRVTVALGGDGGDELFHGYPTFVAEVMLGRWVDRVPRSLVRPVQRVALGLVARLPVSTANFSLDFKLKQTLRGIVERGPRRHQAWLASLLPDEVFGVLSRDVRRHLGDVDLYDGIDERLARCASPEPADRLMYFYARGYLGSVLTKVDRASMHASLEVRAPLLDTQVIALACQLAPGLRSRGLTTKRVLKRVARGLIPDAIIDRPKHGFGMPIAAWLRGPLADFLRDTLSASRLQRDGLFDAASVHTLITEHLAGRANHRKPLWTLLAFHAWLDTLSS